MSSFKDNNTYKKTSFLEGNNSEFIEEFYAEYINNPSSLPKDWKSFFDGLKDNQDVILNNFKGPSWAPEKKLRENKNKKINNLKEKIESPIFIEQATKDSVRAIMLIRAYRIRGHLIANLDPLGIQKKINTLN